MLAALGSIRAKLALLVGVPVLGALVLALFVTHDARERAHSAAALGSIEDLARLTAYIADVMHAVQDERASTATMEGSGKTQGSAAMPRLAIVRRETDIATERLEAFLSARDRSMLPASLVRGVAATEVAMGDLPAFRARADAQSLDITEVLTRYGGATSGLIRATAALSELSDDGAMLRNISAIVALFELEERSSIEHAIVGYAAGKKEFPPGAFKSLVTTVTEEAVYDQALRSNASDEVGQSFALARERGRVAKESLDALLTTTEDTVSLDPDAWDASASSAMNELREVERLLLHRIESIAASKGAELKGAVRLSFGLVFVVVATSVAMAIFMRRGIQRSVQALTDAASLVRSTRDFAVRARRVSNDELGMLTDTFNEMLAGIQSRDAELEQHRSHLEALVVQRTKELADRNASMRLILDNVEQGLAMIDTQGRLLPERSSAFGRWFSAPKDGDEFWNVLAAGAIARGSSSSSVGSKSSKESCRTRSRSTRWRSSSMWGAPTTPSRSIPCSRVSASSGASS